MYAHGMNGRNEAGGAARRLSDMGLAVVAIDTVEHGEHPTSEGASCRRCRSWASTCPR